LATVIPIVMYRRRFNETTRITLITVWSLSVVTVYIDLAIVYYVLMD